MRPVSYTRGFLICGYLMYFPVGRFHSELMKRLTEISKVGNIEEGEIVIKLTLLAAYDRPMTMSNDAFKIICWLLEVGLHQVGLGLFAELRKFREREMAKVRHHKNVGKSKIDK